MSVPFIAELITVSPLVNSSLEIDHALSVLQAHKDSWVAVGIAERLALVEEMQHTLFTVAPDWIAASLAAKEVAAHTLGEAEEWLFLATIWRALRLLRETLQAIEHTGRPPANGPITPLTDNQLAIQVFPHHRLDRLLFPGITGEVWFEPGVAAEAIIANRALAYQQVKQAGKVALVLGAGNISAIPVVDLLHKLFVENQVVALKPNPVNAYLGPLLEVVLGSLIQRGFVRLVYGGTAEGAYLCHHPAVDELHMTGSHHTFEAITFGSGLEGQQRKVARQPLITKRFTCELGNISPVIIVPGPWREADIQRQAVQLATWLVANAGYGCLTPRVMIQHQGWSLRPQLLAAIGRVLASVPTRRAYYPGTRQLHASFLAAHPKAHLFGRSDEEHLPWTFISDLNPAYDEELCFRREAFCGLMAETALAATTPADFLDQAVEFANQTLWGSLCATLIVHPTSVRQPAVAAAVKRAIANLRYGTVMLNMTPFAAYYLQLLPWGGFPGYEASDIQSGIGKTANFLMFDRPQKSVVRTPFHSPLNALTVVSRRPDKFARWLAYWDAAPSPGRLPGLLAAALATSTSI